MFSQLVVQGIELNVCLGLNPSEHKEPQTVYVEIRFFFNTPPAACESDQIQETICYADVIQKIQQEFSLKTFHLIEHLAQAIYFHIQPMLAPLDVESRVVVQKFPKIEGLTQGVKFEYGDSFL